MREPHDDAFEDDGGEVSRSQRRRDALAVLALAERLTELSAHQLDKLPLSPAILDAVRDTQRIRSQIARKRQLQYLAKLMRREEDALEPVRAALEHDRDAQRRETAELHRLEHWRERLLADDAALTEYLDAHPDADRQHLRALIRQARVERTANKPPHAFRDLYRELKRLQQDD